jgi:Spy/CpxP family protein refolding chaperone
MNPTLFTRTAIAALAIALGASTAAAAPCGWGPPRGDTSPGRFLDQRADQLAWRLNLTPDQKAGVRTILREQQGSGQPGVAHARISSLLDQAQRAEFDRIRAFRGAGPGACPRGDRCRLGRAAWRSPGPSNW